jgi:hypothetical protein
LLRQRQDIFTLDNAFALIDGYIDAGFLLLNTFPLQSNGGPYISVTSSVYQPITRELTENWDEDGHSGEERD